MQESVLESHRTFSIASATTDLDQKFDEALGSLTLDVVGKLVQSLTLRGMVACGYHFRILILLFRRL